MKNTILFADDDKEIREIGSQFLEIGLPEYSIEIFPDGASLEKRLNQNTSDIAVVLTDNDMPGISGSKIIKKYSKQFKFPFILQYGGAEDIGEEAIKNGAHSYIRKPYLYRELAEKIKDILENSQ